MTTKRRQVLLINQEDILAILQGHAVLEKLPEGLRVEAVHYDWNKAAFGLVVSHLAFAEVEQGVEMQCIRAKVRYHDQG